MNSFIAFRQIGPALCAAAVWLCLPQATQAQRGCILLWRHAGGGVEDTLRVEILPDTSACLARLSDWRREQWAAGRLEASVDHLEWQGDTLQVWYHLGPRYRWAALDLSMLPPSFRRRAPFAEGVQAGQVVSCEALAAQLDHLLDWHANHGYPFAQVWLDSLHARDSVLYGRLRLQAGPYITMGEVVVEGELRLQPHLLARHTGLLPGTPFSKEKIDRVRQRLEQLPYVRLLRAPWVTFYGTEARLHLALTGRPASRLDLLVGIQPTRQAEGRRIQLTGTAHSELYNALGLGEHLLMRYEQLRTRAPRLRLLAEFPWLSFLPAGAFAEFDLYKRDTQYVELSWRSGLQQPTSSGRHTWRAYVWQQSSSLLSAAAIDDQLDVRTTALGLSYSLDDTDYRFNPHRGWQLSVQGAAGRRRILENPKVLALAPQRYDSLPLRTYQVRLELEGARYVPLARQWVLKAGLSAAALFTDGPVVQNESWRIGGNRLLRGFDEDAFFARHYAVATLEVRLLLERNSWCYLFADGGWWQAPTTARPQRGIGIGAGITFATQGGILRVGMATGQTKQIPFDLANPRVHVGYVSLF